MISSPSNMRILLEFIDAAGISTSAPKRISHISCDSEAPSYLLHQTFDYQPRLLVIARVKGPGSGT